ncbi:ArsA family ATPase [Treponema pedis]|uniref:ArsA family ATPase n=1 Tax=Treponema pedis TaxID=409322 RepID=UPI003133DC0B
MKKIVIFTGKGGVGKTSLSAAAALTSAAENKKTLLVSTDMAHNLGDIFEMNLYGSVTPVSENLDILELNPPELMRKQFSEIKKNAFALSGSIGFGINGLDNSFIIPGFENLFSLMEIKEIYEKEKYERIIVDCPPTGETLSLLKLPELLAWYMEKFFPVGKAFIRVLAPISKLRYGIKLPDKKALNDIEKMHESLLNLQEFLKNKDICSVRLVCTPEKMAVEETKRSFMYLNLYGYQVSGLFINRILPDDTEIPFMENWKSIQEKYIKELHSVFTDIPVIPIPWYPEEIRGKEAVENICRNELSHYNLFDVKTDIVREEYIKTEDGYILRIAIPYSEECKAEVINNNSDISIKLNNFIRCIPLPGVLYYSTVKGMDYSNGKLDIYLKPKNSTANDKEAE